MKKVLFVATFAVFAFYSCGNKTPKTESEVLIEEVEEIKEVHNARNSLDYYGTYEGELPAADAPGIKTTIVLNKDNTYTRKVVFVNRKDNIPEEKGNFTWNADGNIITLEGAEKANQYFVAENRLFALDINGQRITGDLADKYVLTKK
ncbi:copper resistance protein NlpE [Dysgonomonas sp. 25]|uniref:copper resistance protein NlpE n=1 Tax=Dysgonomonas sp. 25 TaxID=2302933 RepID=UPI001625DF3F|nr:copper resistance protein NlpE [Dysgonomonas sp. 25]